MHHPLNFDLIKFLFSTTTLVFRCWQVSKATRRHTSTGGLPGWRRTNLCILQSMTFHCRSASKGNIQFVPCCRVKGNAVSHTNKAHARRKVHYSAAMPKQHWAVKFMCSRTGSQCSTQYIHIKFYIRKCSVVRSTQNKGKSITNWLC